MLLSGRRLLLLSSPRSYYSYSQQRSKKTMASEVAKAQAAAAAPKGKGKAVACGRDWILVVLLCSVVVE